VEGVSSIGLNWPSVKRRTGIVASISLILYNVGFDPWLPPVRTHFGAAEAADVVLAAVEIVDSVQVQLLLTVVQRRYEFNLVSVKLDLVALLVPRRLLWPIVIVPMSAAAPAASEAKIALYPRWSPVRPYLRLV
jgi:hypothetical protein